MFIEIVEYDNHGEKVGTCIINTDDIYYIDNYDKDCRIWELHCGKFDNQDNNISFYIKRDAYEIIKNILVCTDTRKTLD